MDIVLLRFLSEYELLIWLQKPNERGSDHSCLFDFGTHIVIDWTLEIYIHDFLKLYPPIPVCYQSGKIIWSMTALHRRVQLLLFQVIFCILGMYPCITNQHKDRYERRFLSLSAQFS